MTAVALSSLAVLGYTYVGYPLTIELLSRLRPQPAEPDSSYEPRVSVLIPVYNAKSYVEAKLQSLVDQDYPKDRLEVVVYSDCSDDGSDEAVQAFADRLDLKLLRGEKRAGKPTALNRMRTEASGDVFVLTDIRQKLSPNTVRDLVQHLADPAVGAVSGNLVLEGETGAGFYWHYENRIRRAEARFRSMVGVTGPIYALRRDDLPEVPTDIILDDMWIPMHIALGGRRLVLCENAIALDDAFGDERELGRKVRTLAGNFQLFAAMPDLLSPQKNPLFFETFSHKLLRLAGPLLLGTALVSSAVAVVANPTRTLPKLLLGGQLGAYALAALGPKAGKLGTAARTFAVLNYAALAGFGRHVRGAQKITW